MKLSKYLRQNSRTLLMVFMALLLVSFLIPQTIQGLGGRDQALNAKLGQAFGKTVTTRDLDKVRSDVMLLSRVGLLPAMTEEGMLEYFLGLKEAEQIGVHVGRDEVKALLTAGGFTDDRLREVQRIGRRSYDQIYDIVGQARAVNLLSLLQTVAIQTSLPRQELAYRDSMQQATVQLSTIDDKAFLHLVPEPTEEQLQAFFDECKGRTTAHTEDQLQYGYLLPDRVAVEYLTVDPQKIKGKITIQAVQVKRFFEDNPQRYTKPDPLTTQPDAGGQMPRVPQTFEEARDFAREDCRQARAIEMAQRTINDLYLEARQAWATTGRDAEGFTIAPQSPISFEDLKQRATVEVEYAKTDLSGLDKLSRVPGWGSAKAQVARQFIRAPELAMRVKGILVKDPNDGLPALNVMEPAPVVISSQKDQLTGEDTPYAAYLFRVLQVAPSAPPESLEPIRAQVIEDWKSVQAHALAQKHAESLAARARQVGLAQAVEEATELKEILAAADQAASQPAATSAPATQYAQNLQPATPMQFTRQFGVVQRAGGSPAMVPRGVPTAVFNVADTPTDEANPHRVVSVAAAHEQQWIVAQLNEVKPLYQVPFEGQLARAIQTTENRDRQRFVMEWMAPENVKERAGFVFESGRGPRGAPE